MKITQSDLDLFSAASHDVNPMHMDADYARKTAFGEPVVFGILGALAALGHTRDRNGECLAGVLFTFHSPLLRDIEYQTVVTEKSSEKTTVDVFDAGRMVLTAVFTFQPSEQESEEWPAERPGVHRSEPSEWTEAVLAGGIVVAGNYTPDLAKLRALIDRWGLRRKGVSPLQIAILVWSSYLIGMELPGKTALFSRLRLTFETPAETPLFPLVYRARTLVLDPRFQLLKIALDVEAGGLTLASGQAASLIRPESPVSSADSLRALLPNEPRLLGQTALVIGGSRGFGAALSLGLALQGARVLLAYQHSAVEAEAVRSQAGEAPGKIELVQGDATDITWLQTLCSQIQEDGGGLDMLICNACPPIRALAFAPEALGRFQEFITQSVALVSAPAGAFIDLLAKRKGWNVVISSEFVRTVPAEWPHYVAAKYAIEGMTHAIQAQQPSVQSLIVRPPRLLTDQTNTPMGRMDAMPVEAAAAAVIRRFSEPAPDGVETMERFDPLIR
ncbi:MAG: uncharacterized protein JWQ02_1242 [Capsulimonas sp.]|nr:uncharacterized protein [Capsulimonas sp.]